MATVSQTVSQIAAPREPRGLVWMCVRHHPAGPPAPEPKKVRTEKKSVAASLQRQQVSEQNLLWMTMVAMVMLVTMQKR